MIRLTSFSEHSWWFEAVIEFDHGRYPGYQDIVLYTSPDVGWVCRVQTVNSIDDVVSVFYQAFDTLHLPDDLPTFLLVNDDELMRIDL